MNRSLTSPRVVAAITASVFAVAVVGVFAYFTFSYLPATDSAPVLTSYPIDSVLSSMEKDGPYDKASALLYPTTDGSVPGGLVPPAASPATYSPSDIGKTDLSKFN